MARARSSKQLDLGLLPSTDGPPASEADVAGTAAPDTAAPDTAAPKTRRATRKPGTQSAARKSTPRAADPRAPANAESSDADQEPWSSAWFDERVLAWRQDGLRVHTTAELTALARHTWQHLGAAGLRRLIEDHAVRD